MSIATISSHTQQIGYNAKYMFPALWVSNPTLEDDCYFTISNGSIKIMKPNGSLYTEWNVTNTASTMRKLSKSNKSINFVSNPPSDDINARSDHLRNRNDAELVILNDIKINYKTLLKPYDDNMYNNELIYFSRDENNITYYNVIYYYK